MIPVSYNVRSLLVRKMTTLAAAFGVGLVVFVLAAAMMLGAGIKKTMSVAGKPDNAIVLRKGADNELSSNLENRLVNLVLAAPGVKVDESSKPLGSGETVIVIALDKLGLAEGAVSNVLVRGVTDNVFKVRPHVKLIAGRPAQPGTDEVIAGKGVAGRFKGVELNSSFELKKNKPVKVVGVFEADGSSLESEIWGDLDAVRSAFGRDGLVSSVLVRLDSPTKFDAFKATMESDKQLGLEALRESAYYEKQSEGTSIFINAMGGLIAFFCSFGAMIGATITMHAAVAQRGREIGTLRALGFSKLSILFSFMLESCILALLGGAAGLLCALLMSTQKLSMMNFQTWQEVNFSFIATPGVLATAMIAGTVMGLVGGFFPALRAARVSPIDAMRA
jgi:putative ABC transport system permease protein